VENKNVIKEDMNFLEYPIWVLSDANDQKEFVIEKENGSYKISTSHRLPTRTDKIVLYYLLSEAMASGNKVIKTTKYKILKETFDTRSKVYYEKLMDSLKRWLHVSIVFNGSFFTGDGYKTRGFHILSYKENADGLEISIDDQFFEQMKNSEYFKMIDLNEYKKLKRPVSARLYEILAKNFRFRDEWKIEALRLAEKLTLAQDFPSQIIRKIAPAVREITKNTDMKVQFSSYTNDHGETIFCFKNKAEDISLPFEGSNDSETVRFLDLVPEDQRTKSVMAIIRSFKGSEDILISNIEFTNRNAERNYAGYLRMALADDWGSHLREPRGKMCIKYEKLISGCVRELVERDGIKEEVATECTVNALALYLEKNIDEFYLDSQVLANFTRKTVLLKSSDAKASVGLDD